MVIWQRVEYYAKVNLRLLSPGTDCAKMCPVKAIG